MSKMFKLRPDLNLLNRYGYVPDNNDRTKQFKGSICEGDLLVDLNNVPGEGKDILDGFNTMRQYFTSKSALHAFIYICVEQADYFHAHAESAYHAYHNHKTLLEVQTFIQKLQEAKSMLMAEDDAEVEVILKVKSKTVCRVSHPYSLFYLLDSLNTHAESPSGRLVTTGVNFEESSPVKNPYRKIGRLQTIFISKVQEFICNESNIERAKNKEFNARQRELIYYAGLFLGVFSEDISDASSVSDYIEWIYKYNINLLFSENRGE